MKKVKPNKTVSNKIVELELAICLKPEVTIKDLEQIQKSLVLIADNLKKSEGRLSNGSSLSKKERYTLADRYLHILQSLHPILN